MLNVGDLVKIINVSGGTHNFLRIGNLKSKDNSVFTIKEVRDIVDYRNKVNPNYAPNDKSGYVYTLNTGVTINGDHVEGIFDLECQVKHTVDLWVKIGKSFTAYDVTKKLRDDHSKQYIGHNEVKNIVHGLYECGRFGSYYNRTIATSIPVPPGVEHPWLYYKVGQIKAKSRDSVTTYTFTYTFD